MRIYRASSPNNVDDPAFPISFEKGPPHPSRLKMGSRDFNGGGERDEDDCSRPTAEEKEKSALLLLLLLPLLTTTLR